jgi:methylmalonyl-CoA decarboxylase subunit alpha
VVVSGPDGAEVAPSAGSFEEATDRPAAASALDEATQVAAASGAVDEVTDDAVAAGALDGGAAGASAVSKLENASARALRGGPERHREKAREQGKLPVRERVARLLDGDSFAEDALLANWQEDGLGADGVVTGLGRIGGRAVALMANDPTVKAGSWGPKTVEKILRIQERALELRVPMVYLVDSAGARITEQVQMFPGRRGAGRIFHNQVKLSGLVPQVCVLFGPSAAGGAYIPAFCDVVIMREGNASMYLGSPRMAQMVIGENVTLEEMGGARMHTGVSGCGHVLVKSDEEGVDAAKRYLSYLPSNWESHPPEEDASVEHSAVRAHARTRTRGGVDGEHTSIAELIPADENKPFDMKLLLAALLDADSFMEIHARWAKELLVGFARLDGRAVGIVANQPKVKGGVLFGDSADKAARFIWNCNAFNVPLLFLADVPGFMIGTQVERQGIIRHGAKMISAVSEATVPKISVIVRKAYGAGLYAMAGPAFDPGCCLALPSASIAVMGPQAAINAVYYNQLQGIQGDEERAAKTEELRAEYAADIDILHLASELVVDAIVQPEELRGELVRRFALTAGKRREWPAKHNPVTPV